MRHLDAEARVRWDQVLTDPLPGEDPDLVDEDIVAEELAMFAQFAAETG